jgi:hypothetical protein
MTFIDIFKIAQLIVENLAQTSFRFSPICFCTPHSSPSKDSSKKFFLKWGQDEMSFQEPSHLTKNSASGNKELVSTITITQT